MGKIDDLKKKYDNTLFTFSSRPAYCNAHDAIDEAVAITKSEALEQGELASLDVDKINSYVLRSKAKSEYKQVFCVMLRDAVKAIANGNVIRKG